MFKNKINLIKPVIILEDEIPTQNRIKKILLNIGYNYEDLYFCQNIHQAQESYMRHKHSIALVDLQLPDGNGTQFIEFIKHENLDIVALVLSAWNNDEVIINALSAGADGYILKDRDDYEVSFAISNVLKGGTPIDPFIARNILKKMEWFEKIELAENLNEHLLTKREYEILQLVSLGHTNKEISKNINLSRFTVETHIRHIYRKLSVCNRTKAVDTARSLGIL